MSWQDVSSHPRSFAFIRMFSDGFLSSACMIEAWSMGEKQLFLHRCAEHAIQSATITPASTSSILSIF